MRKRERVITDPQYPIIDKPERFNTRYPSHEELNWLQENFYFDEFFKRMKDATPENVILDALERRTRDLRLFHQGKIQRKDWEVFPLDIVMVIALKMDIRQVMDNAKTTVVFAKILLSEDFWKRRFHGDFPEMLVPPGFGRELPVINGGVATWKNYYLVVRYFIMRTRYMLMQYNRESRVIGNEIHSYTYYVNTQDVVVSIMTKQGNVNDIQPYHHHITFHEFLGEYYGSKTYNYLNDMIQYGTNLSDLFIFLLALRDGINTETEGRREMFGVSRDRKVTFGELVLRGYAKKKNDVRVIGGEQQICSNCNTQPAVGVCGGKCGKTVYCSMTCASDHYKTHKTNCH